MASLRRFRQVVHYGWQHAGQISREHFSGSSGKRLSLFVDILRCYKQYRIWSNQYLKESFWNVHGEERRKTGAGYLVANTRREQWLKDFYRNREFFIKYGNVRYEKASLRDKRNKAYARQYNAGKNILVEYDVNISRQHYLDGTISIGNKVLLGKHVFIDYSGKVTIEDNVQLTNGVVIETHHHPFHSDCRIGREIVQPTELMIREGAVIGSRAIILPSCHYIGKYARVGAGAVVTKDVNDFEIVAGVPARVIRSSKAD